MYLMYTRMLFWFIRLEFYKRPGTRYKETRALPGTVGAPTNFDFGKVTLTPYLTFTSIAFYFYFYFYFYMTTCLDYRVVVAAAFAGSEHVGPSLVPA